MRYLKKFETSAEFNNFILDYTNTPNVSLIEELKSTTGGLTFTHYLKPIMDAIITCDSLTYNGEIQIATNINVTLNNITLINGVDYTIINNEGGINVGEYSFIINGIGNYSGVKQGTFVINKVTPTIVIPTPKVLTYNSSSQELINSGSTNYGTMKYSLDNSTWSTSIPTATNYGSYIIYYKVEGNNNINDIESSTIICSINEKQINAIIELSQNTYTYDSNAKEPTVTVKDGSTVIDPSEYTVTYNNNINAGTATVTITDNIGGNYEVIGSTTFTINKANPIYTAPTTQTGFVYDGTAKVLLNTGSTSDGTIQYSSDNSNWNTTIPTGTNANTYTSYWRLIGDINHNDVASISIITVIDKVTPTVVLPTAKVLTYNGSTQELVNAGSTDFGTLQYRAGSDSWSTSIPTRTRGGSYTVEYKVVGDSNINDVVAQSVSCSINEKPVTATVTLSQTIYTYDSTAKIPTPTVKDGGTVIDPSEYSVVYSNNVNVGTGTVTISDNTGGDYNVIGSATFTINKVTPTVTAPTPNSLTYTGSAQVLINAGNTNWGTLKYSLNDSAYSTEIPKGTNATSYTIYYKVDGDSNINSVASQSIVVTIAKADQVAPTATGATVNYGSTATATASGGGGQGSLEWSNGNTRTTVGSQTTKARWIGNTNYNASSWSNEVILEVKQTIITKFNVTSTSSPTQIIYQYAGSPFSAVEIDGVVQSSVVTTYTFSTTGEHTVKYTLKNPTSIGDMAFRSCDNLTSCTVSNGITSIGSSVFENCTKLTSINIPNSVTSIGEDAFKACTGLTSITVDSSNTSYSSENGVLFNKAKTILIQYPLGNTRTSYNIPNGVTSIGGNAFYSCTSLTSISISNSVTSIGYQSFTSCSSLISIIIPNSVTSIGNRAFNSCTSLTSCTIGSGVASIDYGAFGYCNSLTSITCNATTAPTIQNGTFQNVKTGGTLTVPSGSTGYDVWMGTGNYYLGKYYWTKVEQ